MKHTRVMAAESTSKSAPTCLELGTKCFIFLSTRVGFVFAGGNFVVHAGHGRLSLKFPFVARYGEVSWSAEPHSQWQQLVQHQMPRVSASREEGITGQSSITVTYSTQICGGFWNKLQTGGSTT